ncbi:MAG TPA: hypothetical protein VGX75_14155 [bacterium]|nr:hypothetical protein [bacterium]
MAPLLSIALIVVLSSEAINWAGAYLFQWRPPRSRVRQEAA